MSFKERDTELCTEIQAHSKEKAIPNRNPAVPDRVLRELAAIARKTGADKVILFGSRARGTHTERSDIDIAVIGGDFDAFYWAVKETVHSLLTFDIVNYSAGVSDELKEEIEKDGVIVYKKACAFFRQTCSVERSGFFLRLRQRHLPDGRDRAIRPDL